MDERELQLGFLVDVDDEEDDSQEEVNEINLYVYDQSNFLELLKHRVNRYILEDYLTQFPIEDSAIWEKAFQTMIRTYSLNNLKTYQTEIKISNFEKHVIDLIRDVKIKIQDDIADKKLNADITLGDMDEFTQSNGYHLFFKWSIRFLDKFSFKRFMKKVFEESKLPYVGVEDLDN